MHCYGTGLLHFARNDTAVKLPGNQDEHRVLLEAISVTILSTIYACFEELPQYLLV